MASSSPRSNSPFEFITFNNELLRQNSEYIAQLLKDTAGHIELVYPPNEYFTIQCFATCIHCLGNFINTQNSTQFFARFESRLSPYSTHELFHLSVYLQSEILFNFTCIDRLDTYTAPYLADLLLQYYGKEHPMSLKIFSFLKMTCNIDTVQIIQTINGPSTSLYDLVRNKKRSLSRLIHKKTVLPTPCTYCQLQITASKQNYKPMPMSCCKTFMHLSCQQQLIKTLNPACPACNKIF